MRSLILLLIPLFLLSSCSIDWNDEKDKKIAELQKQIQNDTFKKKDECGKYADEMLGFARKYYKTENNNSTLEVTEIFYSQKNNSCYFVTQLDEGKNQFKSIFDFLGKKLYMQSPLYESNNLDNELSLLKQSSSNP